MGRREEEGPSLVLAFCTAFVGGAEERGGVRWLVGERLNGGNHSPLIPNTAFLPNYAPNFFFFFSCYILNLSRK